MWIWMINGAVRDSASFSKWWHWGINLRVVKEIKGFWGAAVLIYSRSTDKTRKHLHRKTDFGGAVGGRRVGVRVRLLLLSSPSSSQWIYVSCYLWSLICYLLRPSGFISRNDAQIWFHLGSPWLKWPLNLIFSSPVDSNRVWRPTTRNEKGFPKL